MIKELGTFEISSGKVRVCDPCYNRTVDVPIMEDVLPGKYIAEIAFIDTGKYGIRVGKLSIWHEDYTNVAPKIPASVRVGVDSGQAGFYDDQFYPIDQDKVAIDEFYDKACELTLSEDCGGIIDNFGAVSSTGYGDGEYVLYIGLISEGWIVSAMIDFEVEEDYDDE